MKKIKKEDLFSFFKTLKDSYKVIGPKIKNGSIILSAIEFNDIPFGYRDFQGKATYKLEKISSTVNFSFSNGMDSFKRFFFPPQQEIFLFHKSKKGIQIKPVETFEDPIALFGVRACDLTALKLYDRIFLEGPVKDITYQHLRANSFIVALNCIYPSDNCFCSSMETGPEVKDNFDVALTEIDNFFIIEAKTHKAKGLIDKLSLIDVDNGDLEKRSKTIEECKRLIKKHINSHELPQLIYRNLEHSRWLETAKKDLECGNCTQVCPTCFCNSTYDRLTLLEIKKYPDVSGIRIRSWDSCFSRNFARVHGGNFRHSRKARYRHWLCHKMVYMKEQFGITGCVGCGRCITWCPAGIDITEEVNALKR